MDGHTIGVFGTDRDQKTRFEASIAKKSEVEGMMTVYHRTESGKRFTFLDDPLFPEKIQPYARIASIADHAYYIFPKGGKLTPPDGELAVLLDSLALHGTVEILDGAAPAEAVRASFKGMALEKYAVEDRNVDSSIIDLAGVGDAPDPPPSGALVFVDRAFSVKGVGTVVLGFVVSGSISLHDELRVVPSLPERRVEIKGIQINDEDHETAGKGIRVGLSLRGIEAKDLDKALWLDDGSFTLTDKLSFEFKPSPFYRQTVQGRDMHIQLPGPLLVSRLAAAPEQKEGRQVVVGSLPHQVPVWSKMRVALIDLNGKSLRVAGGGRAMTNGKA